jgi:TRAP-type mannitol/chloroaromatic compound transport system permease small subunit
MLRNFLKYYYFPSVHSSFNSLETTSAGHNIIFRITLVLLTSGVLIA